MCENNHSKRQFESILFTEDGTDTIWDITKWSLLLMEVVSFYRGQHINGMYKHYGLLIEVVSLGQNQWYKYYWDITKWSLNRGGLLMEVGHR